MSPVLSTRIEMENDKVRFDKFQPHKNDILKQITMKLPCIAQKPEVNTVQECLVRSYLYLAATNARSSCFCGSAICEMANFTPTLIP